MSEDRNYIQHYHTTNPNSIPSSDLLNTAEIALNIAPDNEKIFIKNTDNEIVTFRDEKYYNENFLNKNSEIIANIGHKPYVPFGETTKSILPNEYYRLTGETSSIEIYFEEPTNNGIMNEYFIEFTTTNGITPTISFPLDVKWVDGIQPEWLDGYTYQVSIVNNLGVVTKFK